MAFLLMDFRPLKAVFEKLFMPPILEKRLNHDAIRTKVQIFKNHLARDILFLRRRMLHPTVKSRLIFVRRLILHALIEFFLKILSALLSTGINDMTITLRNHLRLCMTGVTLYSLDVAAG